MVAVPKMIGVESATIEGIGYDPEARELYVWFRSPPGVYAYRPVAASVFEEFQHAESKGEYFNRSIKGHYIYRPALEDSAEA